MTYAEGYARSGAVFEFFLLIDGCLYVMGTSTEAPIDNWYLTEGHSYLKGLRAESLKLGCSAAPGEVWPDVPAFDAEFVDVNETLGAYLKSLESDETIKTELTASFAVGDLVITVGDTAQFPAGPDVVYLNQEAFLYGAKGATEFQNLTPGYLNSVPSEHHYDIDIFPPVAPEVTDGPGDLRGRRATIYAAERINGVLGASSAIWIGDVGGYLEFSSKRVRIPMRHMVKAFQTGKIFGAPPQAEMRGLYIPNLEGASRGGDPFGNWGYFAVNDSVTGVQDLSPVTEGTSEFFASREALVTEWLAAVEASTGWNAGENPSGLLYIANNSGGDGEISGDGTLSTLLGFDVRTPTWARVLDGGTIEATSPPVSFFFSPGDAFLSGGRSRVYLKTGQAALFVESGITVDAGGDAGPRAYQVTEVNTVSDYLEIQPSPRMYFYASAPGYDIRSFGDGPPPIVRGTWELFGCRLDQAVRMLWGGSTYPGLTAFPYTAPQRWMASAAMDDADVDWDALTPLVENSPFLVKQIQASIDEPTEVSEILTGHLLCCGIYAYIKDDGKVGWRQARIPAEGESGTTVDSTLVLAKEAANVSTEYGRDKLMNILQLDIEYKADDDSGTKGRILIVDQLSVQRYGPSMARDVSDPTKVISGRAQKLPIYRNPRYIPDAGADLATKVMTTVMALLSRPRTVARFPVSIKARGIAIGDIVSVTSEWVRDGATGLMGVEDKLGIVMGWTRPLGSEGTDYLEVMLIDDPTGVIAPAAKATTWTAGTKTLDFADVTLYKLAADTTDLDWLEAGDKVIIEQYDAAVPTTWTAEIASVDTVAKTVVLTTAPVGLAVPAILRFDDYSNCSADQLSEGWIWSADNADGQVNDAVGGRRWA